MDARHKQKPWILLGIFVLSCSTGDALLPAASVRKHFAATSSASARKRSPTTWTSMSIAEGMSRWYLMQSGKLWGQRVENMRASFEHFKAVAASEPVLKSSHMAAAKTKAAAVAAAAAAAAAVPSVGDFVAGPEFTAALKMACFLPALLGLWKAEYTVSYGYGLAMASVGMTMLRAGGASLHPLAKVQAVLLAIYGVRLNLFLLWRQLNVQYSKDLVQRIEEKRPSRVKRLPFILGCGCLYYCMAAPLVLTAQYAAALAPRSLGKSLVYGVGVGGMALGLIVAAFGDLQKTVTKKKFGPSTLVTGGLFSVLRHPNYTGEQLLWSTSFFIGLVCALAGPTSSASVRWLMASGLGCLGINLVLMQATSVLEDRQATTYGSTLEYQAWIANTFAGFTLPEREKQVFDENQILTSADAANCEATEECEVPAKSEE